MRTYLIFALILIFSVSVISACSGTGHQSLWERKCASCHDGVTKLNDKVVPDKEQLKAKYASLDDFTTACDGSPSCMNILKHNRDLLRSVGKEIGINPSTN